MPAAVRTLSDARRFIRVAQLLAEAIDLAVVGAHALAHDPRRDADHVRIADPPPLDERRRSPSAPAIPLPAAARRGCRRRRARARREPRPGRPSSAGADTASIRTQSGVGAGVRSACSRLAATARLASSATSATRSPRWIARHVRRHCVRPERDRQARHRTSSEKCISRPPAGRFGHEEQGRQALVANHEGGHLSAARGDVGEAGRAQARQIAGHPAAEEIRREIDQHVAHRHRSGSSNCGNTSRRTGIRSCSTQRAGPDRERGLQAQRPSRRGVISQPSVTPVPPYSSFGLSTQRLAMLLGERQQIDSAPVLRRRRIDETRVHGTCAAITRALGVREQRRVRARR